MTDIVERLRDRHICPCEFADHDNAILEAADEIARLRAENERLTGERDSYSAEALCLARKNIALRAEVERLRAALKGCIAMLEQLGYTPISKVARAALEGK